MTGQRLRKELNSELVHQSIQGDVLLYLKRMNILNRNTKIKDQFFATYKWRYKERDLELIKSTTKVTQEHSTRGVLWSSMYGQALNEVYIDELRASAKMLVTALLESVQLERRYPNFNKLQPWLSEALNARKVALQIRLSNALNPLKSRLSNHSLLEPPRSIDDWCGQFQDETQEQFRIRYSEYQANNRPRGKEHWWKLVFLVPIALVGWFNEIWEFMERIPTYIAILGAIF